MNRNLSLPLSLSLLISCVPVAAWAIVVPPVAEPGRVEQQLHIEPSLPAVGGESIITVPDETGHDKKLAANITFKLKGITFTHLTVFSEADLRKDYADSIGKEVSLQTINQIAGKITAHYRNAGYILSRAVVPPQRIENGVVKIQIVEGYVNKVLFEGKKIEGTLMDKYADKIRTAKPLDAATLERYLLLIEDLPGVTARAVLRPAANAPGASDVVITISEKKIDGSVTLDNRGTRFLGPVQGGATVNANNVFGWYDHTQLHGSVTAETNELQFFEISHDEPLDSEGTRLTLSAGRTHTSPSYKLREFDIDGVDTTYSADITHPFIRSRQSNLYGDVKFDIRNTDSKSLGTDLYGDRLRVGRVGTAYDFVDRFQAINRVDAQLSKGFGWDDDTAPFIRSRVNGQTSFWKGVASANRLQPISGPFGLYLATTGQVASDALLSAEQFGIGGPTFGSAYDPSELTGDSGIAGRAELQYSRSGDFQYIPNMQFYGFYDGGEVWLRNPSGGLKKTSSLVSSGLGVRFNAVSALSGDLELAVPMTKPVSANGQDGNDARVFFSLAYRY